MKRTMFATARRAFLTRTPLQRQQLPMVHRYRMSSSTGDDSTSPHKQPLTRIATHMTLLFTCGKCDARTAKTFSRQAYERGAVMVTCPSCNARHVIADNVDFFGFKVENEQPVMRVLPHAAVGDDDASALRLLSDDDRALVEQSLTARREYEDRKQRKS